MKCYYSANEYFKKVFGFKVYKLALEGGTTCPNRDGSKSVGGCIFCSGAGSGDFAEKRIAGWKNQLENAKSRVKSKNGGGKYIAYYQSFTSTYAPLCVIKKMVEPALSEPEVVAISIATRPDCLPDETIEFIAEIAKIKPVFVELGLQTSNEKTAEIINRGYLNVEYERAATLLKKAGANVITHLIIGLPCEGASEIGQSVSYACKYSDGLKLQLLQVLKRTKLNDMFERGEYTPLTFEEYATLLTKAISLVPENIVIHRITGDPPKKLLVAPLWCADKKRVLNLSLIHI